MSIATQKQNVPRLRFLEFSGKWKEEQLGDINNDIKSGKTKPSTVGSFPVYGSTGQIGVCKNYTHQSQCILIARVGANAGMINFVSGKFSVTDNTLIIEDNEPSVLRFVFYLLIKTNLNKLVFGSGQPLITGGQLKSLRIFIPKPEEQQKIASFLSSVDKKIEQLGKKKKLLEQYKKGMMQKLFTQQIRFKDENGNDYPDWKKKKLGDIGDFQTSSVDKLSTDGEKEVFLVNYMNVYRHESISQKTISELQVVTAKDSQVVSSNLKKGDILFTPSSETPSDIGHSVVIFEDLEDCVYSYHLMRFRPKVKLNILYSHYFCNIPSILKQLSKLATGSTRFTISIKSFSSVEINLPHIAEQALIANFLAAIDDKINLMETELAHAKTFKKGLLQQMFV